MQSNLSLEGGLSPLDLIIMVGVLLAVTWLGHSRAGKQRGLSDFFLGGRRLPWWAVSASIVATEISAVTFVSLPSVVARDGGNLTYLQIGLFGSLVARAIVGFVLLPAYYEQQIYSPYDYVARKLGPSSRRVTTALFSLGGILGQSARVYLTAVVVEVVLHAELVQVQAVTGIAPFPFAVGSICVVSIIWTQMGGIATVVWTDAVLFGLFLLGIGATLWFIGVELSGGWSSALQEAREAGKLQLIDTSWDPAKAYTLPVAFLVASWGQVGPYGTDQMMVQRLLCCPDVRAARKAILWSIVAMGVTLLVSMVGVGLWAYGREHGFSLAGQAMIAEKPDRIFPVFIAEVLPNGIKGLVLAGAFAAAVSSLDSILAALSQTTLVAWGRDQVAPARALSLSRRLVLLYGVLLGLTAIGIQFVEPYYASLLDLALAMAGYTGGALLAAFILAFAPLRVDGSGLAWSAPLSLLAVFAMVWHDPWAQGVVLVCAVLLALVWAFCAKGRGQGSALVFLLGLLGCLLLTCFGQLPQGGSLPWPWYTPVGTVVALVFGWALDRQRVAASAT